jgi:hypothetical protein
VVSWPRPPLATGAKGTNDLMASVTWGADEGWDGNTASRAPNCFGTVLRVSSSSDDHWESGGTRCSVNDPWEDTLERREAGKGMATQIASREAVETCMIEGEAGGTALWIHAISLSETTSMLDATDAGRVGRRGVLKAGEPSGKEGIGASASSPVQ